MHGSFSDQLVLVLRVLCVHVRSGAGVMERDRLNLARGTTLVVNLDVDHERCADWEGSPFAKLSLVLEACTKSIASASSHRFARM